MVLLVMALNPLNVPKGALLQIGYWTTELSNAKRSALLAAQLSSCAYLLNLKDSQDFISRYLCIFSRRGPSWCCTGNATCWPWAMVERNHVWIVRMRLLWSLQAVSSSPQSLSGISAGFYNRSAALRFTWTHSQIISGLLLGQYIARESTSSSSSSPSRSTQSQRRTFESFGCSCFIGCIIVRPWILSVVAACVFFHFFPSCILSHYDLYLQYCQP